MVRLLLASLILLAGIITLGAFCDCDETENYDIYTRDATDVTDFAATLNGRVRFEDERIDLRAGFLWSTEPELSYTEWWDQEFEEVGPVKYDGLFTLRIAGLMPETTYYYRAVYSDYCGHVVSFTTLAASGVAVVTLDATVLSDLTATLNGELVGLGETGSVEVCFRWGSESGAYTKMTPVQTMDATGTFSAQIGPLETGVTYHFLACAEVPATGTRAQGAEQSFKVTDAVDAAVLTLDATGVSTLFATLNGELLSTTGGSSVEVYFLWGTESGVYTNETAHQTMAAPGVFLVEVAAVFTPGNDYYFVARAGTTGEGQEKSFHVY